jgi:3-methyladenine DNA glycosylase AlkD
LVPRSSIIEATIKNIRAVLIDNRELDPERISFFNSIIPGCRNPLVVKTPVLNEIARDTWKEYKTDLQAYLALCDKLWLETEYYEEKKVAILLLTKLVKKYPEEVLEKLLRYFSELYTWDLVDQFGTKLCSELVFHNFDILKNFKHWTTSSDFWVRRLSLVCLIKLRNIQLSFDQWLEVKIILKQLWRDKEHYVQKAMAWCLRELSKMNSDKVTHFLRDQLSQNDGFKLPSKSFIKSCIKKLSTSNQDSILNLL